jgi:hypothetical protein
LFLSLVFLSSFLFLSFPFSPSLLLVGSLELAEAASRLIQVIISKDPTVGYFSLLSQCVEQHKSNPVLIYRYLSLIATLCVENEEITKRCIEFNIPSLVFSSIRSSTSDPSKMDILSAINGIEIMKRFSTTDAGLAELLKDHILDWLVHRLLLPSPFFFSHSYLFLAAPFFSSFRLIEIGCGNPSTHSSADPFLGGEALRILGEIFIQASKSSSQVVSKINRNFIEIFLETLVNYMSSDKEDLKIIGEFICVPFLF